MNFTAKVGASIPTSLRLYLDRFRAKKQTQYSISAWARDVRDAQWMYDDCAGDLEQLQKIYDAYLDDTNSYHIWQGWPLKFLRMKFNAYKIALIQTTATEPKFDEYGNIIKGGKDGPVDTQRFVSEVGAGLRPV